MVVDAAVLDEASQWILGRQDWMLERTIALAEVNSGSFNVAGVNQVGDMLRDDFSRLGGQAERLPVAPFETVADDGSLLRRPLGDALRIRKHPQAPVQVFLCGHLDTVFGADHPFQQVKTLEEGIINGPGVADLKGGLIVMLTALQALERSPLAGRLGWEVLLNPDEEIGSQGSAELIAQAAGRCHVGLIYEPSFPDGSLAGERKGSGNFALVARGRAAHAGREHHLGRNAIRALCDAVSAIDALNGQRDGVTFNPGYIHGGGAVNIVPDTAVARFNVRLARPEDTEWCLQQIEKALAPIQARDGIRIELHGGFTRPPKLLSDQNLRLLELARDCGRRLGLELAWHSTGGCCDGNNLAAAGVPNIDTLGVRGGKIHSAEEYMHVDSLSERARLSALLLMRLAAGELAPVS